MTCFWLGSRLLGSKDGEFDFGDQVDMKVVDCLLDELLEIDKGCCSAFRAAYSFSNLAMSSSKYWEVVDSASESATPEQRCQPEGFIPPWRDFSKSKNVGGILGGIFILRGIFREIEGFSLFPQI